MMQKMGHLLNYGSAVHCVGVMSCGVVPRQAQSTYAGLAHLRCLQRPLPIQHGRQHLSGEGSHSKQPIPVPSINSSSSRSGEGSHSKQPSTAAAAAVAGQMQDLLCGMAKALMTHLTRQQGLLHQAVASQQHQICYSFPRHHHHHISRDQPVRGQSSACSKTLSGSLCQTDTDAVGRMGRLTNRQTDRQAGRGAGKQVGKWTDEPAGRQTDRQRDRQATR